MHGNNKMIDRRGHLGPAHGPGDLRPGHGPPRIPIPVNKPNPKSVDTVAFSVRRPALVVRGASKKYGSHLVLHNLNMFAKEGQIYCLIGAGSSGKTTILECIAGLKRLTKGELLVFGSKPGSTPSGIPGRRVGFLPQELSLHVELTVTETLQYFGRMYGMSQENIKERQEVLSNILSLQSCEQRLSQLSVSERKRASIACCLLHEPELLVFDEFSRGLDPLFKRGIWTHLTKLVSDGRTSVILTSQNIEEARQAHRLGVLRGGRLIVEDSPIALLQRHNSPLLEDVVARICYKETAKANAESEKDNDKKKNGKGGNGIEEVVLVEDWSAYGMPNGLPPVTETDVKSISYSEWMDQVSHEDDNLATKKSKPLKKREMENLPPYPNPSRFANRLRALAVKQIILTQRNFWYILLRFLLTAVLITIFCVAIGPDPQGIRIGLLDNDSDSPDFISECLEEEDMTFNCKAEKMSCRFIRSIPRDLVTWVPLEDQDEAENSIKLGSITGYLEFTSMFSTDIFNKIVQEEYTSPDDNSSSLIVHLDSSNTVITKLVKTELTNRYKSFEEEIALDCAGLDRSPAYDANATLMKMEESPLMMMNGTSEHVNNNHNHSRFVGPAIPLVIVFLVTSLTSSSLFQRELREGILTRAFSSGVSTIEVLVLHWFVELLIVAGHVAIVTVIPVFAFQTFSINGFWLWPVLLYAISGIGGLTLGYMTAMVSSCRLSTLSVALLYLVANLLFSGVMWPTESLLLELQWISYFLPISLASKSARYMIIGGWDITVPKVWQGFVAVSAWTTFHFIVMLLVILCKYLLR